MKNILLFISAFSLFLPMIRAETYTVEQIIEATQESDFSIRARAQKVYQARDRIKVSIGRLLPSLNFNTISAGVGQNYLDLAASLLGFLFPSNWFKWKESKHYFEVEKRSYATLIANEVNAVESLAYRIHNVRTLQDIYKEYLIKVNSLVQIAKKRAESGEDTADVVKRFTNTQKQMQNDITVLDNGIVNQYADLAATIGIKVEQRTKFKIAPIELPNLSTQLPIDEETLTEPILAASLELQGFSYLKKAAEYGRYDRTYEFLAPSSDPDGSFGFGYFAYIRVAKSKEQEVQIQEENMRSNLVKAVQQVVSDYNVSLELYKESAEGLENAVTWFNLLEAKFKEGGQYEPTEYIEAIEALLAFASRVSQAQHKFLISKAQVDRLTWNRSDYQKIWNSVPKEPGKLSCKQRWENWRISKSNKKDKKISIVSKI